MLSVICNFAISGFSRIQYVYHLAHFRMQTQIKDQTAAFIRGFRALVRPEWLQMFSPPEVSSAPPSGIRCTLYFPQQWTDGSVQQTGGSTETFCLPQERVATSLGRCVPHWNNVPIGKSANNQPAYSSWEFPAIRRFSFACGLSSVCVCV